MAMLAMAGDLMGPTAAAGGARLRRVLCTEAHSWVLSLLEGGAVDFPTVECALLPGGWEWLIDCSASSPHVRGVVFSLCRV